MMTDHDPAFIDFAEDLSFGYYDFPVHAGAEYDKQILIHSAVLARRIMDYVPHMAHKISWNPWDPSGLMSAIGEFLDAFYTHCFPIFHMFDGLCDAVQRLYWIYPVAHGFNPYESNHEAYPDGSLMVYMVIQGNAESHYQYDHDCAALLEEKELPPFNLYRLIGKIAYLIRTDTGVVPYTLPEASASCERNDLSVNERLAQFLFLLRWLSNSTGIELMDVDIESAMCNDDPISVENAFEVRSFVEDWRRGVTYYDVMRELNAWTAADPANLEHILEYVRQAGRVIPANDTPPEQLGAEIAELFVSMCTVYDETIVDAPKGYWKQMSPAGVDAIAIAKQLIHDTYDWVGHIFDDEVNYE